jgi:glycine hydroxymethyltransferase
MHTVAATAVALGEAATPGFRAYAHQVTANARALAEGLAAEGMRLQTGGTDTHLITAATTPLGVDGTRGRGRCAAARIVLDKCALPGDPVPAGGCSGVRVGTAAVSSQGMAEPEMAQIAKAIGAALREEPGTAARVAELVAAFPPYRR